MQHTAIKSRINKELDILPVELQQKVLDYIMDLPKPATTHQTDGEKLASFAGTLTREEAEEMMNAINEDCGKIDENW